MFIMSFVTVPYVLMLSSRSNIGSSEFIILSIMVILIPGWILAGYSIKKSCLGPSIFSNGILMISRNPLRLFNEFAPFHDIGIVLIGLNPDSLSDRNLAQRYLGKPTAKSEQAPKEFIEDCGKEMVFLVMKDGTLRYLMPRYHSMEDKLTGILKYLNVKHRKYDYA